MRRSHLNEEEGGHNMGDVLAVRKGLTCSRIWKTSAIGTLCAGVHLCEMTLNKYQGQIMQILFDHVKEYGFYSK